MEQALLKRARAGDQRAFARLVTLHREAVYRAAYWVLKDPEDALDATQEACLKAYRHIHGFEGKSSFKTWIRRIATNVALDRYNRRKRERAHSSDLPAEESVGDPRGEAVDAGLLRRERRRIVREAIEALPAAQRSAVLLRDVEGLSYDEIAETLRIPRGTVMSRIYYGRVTLKEKLAGLLGPRAEEIRAARVPEGAE